MNCYNCGAELTEHDFCMNCGADVARYKKVVSVSNFYYNDGLEKANVRDLSGAVVSLTECLKLNKMNIEARNLLGLVYFEMGETVDALSEWVISKNLQPEKNIADAYIEAVQNSPSQLENLNQAIKKYNQALVYCRQGSLDLALIQLRKVLSINSKFLRAHQLLALLHMHNEDWDKAKRELVKCSRIDVGNTMTLRYMKEVNAALNVDEGVKNVHKAAKTEDVIKYQSGNETIIQPLAVKEPKKNYTGLLYLFGGVAIGLAVSLTLILPGRLQSLKAQLNEESRSIGEQLDKKNAELTDMQKQLDTLTAKNDELNSELEVYAGKDGTLQTVEDLLNAAYTYLDTPEDMEKISQALEGIDKEAMQSDTISEAYKNLYAKLLETVGPKISEAYTNSGNKSYKAGDYENAILDLEKAFSYDETNGDALFILGNAYKKKGDSKNAAKIYNQVIEQFPNTEKARRAKDYLKELES